MKTSHIVIGAVVVGVGIFVLHQIVTAKTTVVNTGTTGAKPAVAPGATGTGTGVYTVLPNATLRSSPGISNGFLGFGGNNIATITNAGTWVGTYTGNSSPDTDGTLNQATGVAYNWWQVNLAPAYASSNASGYVREDYATIK